RGHQRQRHCCPSPRERGHRRARRGARGFGLPRPRPLSGCHNRPAATTAAGRYLWLAAEAVAGCGRGRVRTGVAGELAGRQSGFRLRRGRDAEGSRGGWGRTEAPPTGRL
ncbi:uncharacterized protein METZ01_LOCUS410325, partial [marine metagenome]